MYWQRDFTNADGYYRVSSSKQASQGHALERYREYLLSLGIQEDRIFFDVGSGADYNRPGYQTIIKRVREGITRKIVVPELSRLSRDPEEWERTMREFAKLGVQIETVDGLPIDIATPEGILSTRQSMAGAAYIREKNKWNAKKGWANLKAKKRATHPPFGYTVIDYKFVLTEDAQIVKQIFDIYRKCGSARETLKVTLINWADKPTPKTHKGMLRLLKDPIYKGVNSSGVEAPAIISVAEWKEVESLLASKKQGRGYPKSQNFPAQGLIKCECCGSGMTGRYMSVDKRYPDKKYGYYHCIDATQTKKVVCTNTRGIPFKQADIVIQEAIGRASREVAEFISRGVDVEETPEQIQIKQKLELLGNDPDFEDSRKKLLNKLKALEASRFESNQEKGLRRDQITLLMEVIEDPEYWKQLPNEKKRRYFRLFVDYCTGNNGRITNVFLKPLF